MRNIAIVGMLSCMLALSAGVSALAANDQDRSFLHDAMQDNVDLRALSDYAAQKVRDPKVRDFARMVSQRSNSVDSLLARSASRSDVRAPGALSLRASDQYSRIQAQNPRDAVDEYLRDVAIDARISEDDYTGEAQSGTEPALKRLASDRAAELERIARQADALRGSLR